MARQTLFNFISSDDPSNIQECYATDSVIYNNSDDNIYWLDTSKNIKIRNSAAFIFTNSQGGYSTTYILVTAFGPNSFTVGYGGGTALFNVENNGYYSRPMQDSGDYTGCYLFGSFNVTKTITSNVIPVFTDYNQFYNYVTSVYIPDIIVIKATFAGDYYRLRVSTTGNLVYDNGDRNKYINQTISGGPGGNYNFYNSATLFYNLSGRNGIATSIICDAPYSWVWEYSSDNTNWTTAQGPYSSSLNQNGVYAVSYDVGSESDSGSIVYMFFNAFKFGNDSNWSVWNITDSLIPIFNNDVDAYQNYITNTYVPVTIKVSYIIPDDEYTYCNLTWKKDYEPEDKNDGYTATILKDESVINVTGLEENAKYVFKIFTSKSESEPFSYIVTQLDHYPVPEQFRTEYNNIFIMPLSNISQPPGGGSWDYGYQQFIDTYLPHYTDYSYSGLNGSPYMLDVTSATTNTSSDIRMSSTKIDMLITPDNKIKFRNYVSDVSLNGYSKLQYRYLASYDCKMVGPYSYDSSDVWGDKSFNSDVDLWTYISRNIRFVNVYYGINWDNALIMR